MISLFALTPILVLLIILLVLKMPARKASAFSVISTIIIAYLFFGVKSFGLAVSIGKGMALSLFVILIIWAAIFLYNLVLKVGALNVISRNINLLVKKPLAKLLLLSWVFASFLQGIAGFGVPVVIVVPILIGIGFEPFLSAAAVLIGHSWSISFGSMGSSIYAMDMVTNTPINEIVNWMVMFGYLAMLMTGFAVCYLYDRKTFLRNGIIYVLPLSLIMYVVLFIVVRLEMFSLIGITTGLIGILSFYFLHKSKNLDVQKEYYKDKLTIWEAAFPYLLIIVFSICLNIINPKLTFSLTFPGYVTTMGVKVAPEVNYAKISLFKHPATIILFSSIISYIIYTKKLGLNILTLKEIVNSTIEKCVPITLTLVFLIIIAVLMTDSGMINVLAEVVVNIAKNTYPLLSPFVGLLGAFITGSNTNSNVIFGRFQETVAKQLGINAAIICAIQSIGASIGGAIGPTTTALAATAASVSGKESSIYKKTLLLIIGSTFVLGLTSIIITLLWGKVIKGGIM